MTEKPRTLGPRQLFDYIRKQLGLANDPGKLVLYPAKAGKNKLLLSREPLDDLLRLQEEAG